MEYYSDPFQTSHKINKKLLLYIIIPVGIIAGLGIGYVISNTMYKSNNSKSTLSSSPISSLNSSEQIQIQKIDFGVNIYKNLLIQEETNKLLQDQNFMISPISIDIALLMAYEGSGGNTKKEFENILNIKITDQDALNATIKTRLSNLNASFNGITLNIANSIFYNKDLVFKSSYLDIIKSTFNTDLFSKDFSNISTINDINNWVSTKTNGKISTIIDQINNEAVLYLLNAIYFNGSWKYEFDKTKTTSKIFNQTDNTKLYINFMNQTRKNFQYYEDDIIKEVKIAYGKDEKYSMIIFLPKKNLDDFYKNLSSFNLSKWLNSFEEREGTLYLPKFKIESDFDLNKTFIELGLKDAFDSKNADFSNIRSEKDLFISKVIHKTYIDVNEVGTTAAAVTDIKIDKGAIQVDTFFMDVNKPFFYIIRDDKTEEILFMGQLIKPE